MIIDCPVCNGKGTAESTTKTENIPYFGEVMESSLICNACGYKHNDIISLEQKDPIKLTLAINKDTLSSRVIKSQSATVSIPELGLKVEPGPKSLGYVSNVEGVITRFEEGVNRALTIFDDDESQKNGLAILEKLDKLIAGMLEATLIIEDPFGQSNLMDINVKKEELTKEELKNLKTGFAIIEDINPED
ncbi:ZPR1 zinc-finger domain protein [Methanobrevibacter cuticularis]|uniref:ZPR1 zinc-finger domain protein n=1 Tax=Methanobrevibacter cuticularis TaxID=47311 RepID=A0A166CV24_9EURY|nr:ZPR1 zinc finger domain-containing protein [Methanobrevibacter cuticularis]KZX14893.1 ZPR1 zinc-finger domain protein [Methanobrevibacter cuticularis]